MWCVVRRPPGYGCQLEECPRGDDPLTTGQSDEKQELYCQCAGTCSGSLKLKFRDEVTAEIANNANAQAIADALEALSTVGDVTVTLATGAALCTAAGNSAVVTFLADHGDLPAIKVHRFPRAASPRRLHRLRRVAHRCSLTSHGASTSPHLTKLLHVLVRLVWM